MLNIWQSSQQRRVTNLQVRTEAMRPTKVRESSLRTTRHQRPIAVIDYKKPEQGMDLGSNLKIARCQLPTARTYLGISTALLETFASDGPTTRRRAAPNRNMNCETLQQEESNTEALWLPGPKGL
jgi:hypothetical protein